MRKLLSVSTEMYESDSRVGKEWWTELGGWEIIEANRLAVAAIFFDCLTFCWTNLRAAASLSARSDDGEQPSSPA